MKGMNMLRAVSVGVAAAFVVIGQPVAARAGLLVYEPFDYATGTIVDALPATGLNLTGNYVKSPTVSQHLVIAEPGLNYGNLSGSLPSVAGNRLSDASGVGPGLVNIAVGPEILIGPGAGIFFSALFTFSDATNGNRFARISLIDDDSGDTITFGEASVGVRAVRIEADTIATGGLVANGADGAFTNGQTLWLIGRYMNNAAGDDALELVGYDTALPQSIAADFNLADPNAQFAYSLAREIDLAKISSIGFAIRGDSNNFIDELRIGASYDDVVSAAPATAVPEPATGVLLLAGLAGIGLGRAARRRGRGRSRRPGPGEC
jgi:PEP-CTERM motif